MNLTREKGEINALKIKVKFFHESNKPQNAEKAVRFIKNRSLKKFEIVNSSLYLNKGSIVECSAEVSAEKWTELVFKVIQFAQSIGVGWSISGNIERELLISSIRPNLAQGVAMIDISIVRSDFEENYE